MPYEPEGGIPLKDNPFFYLSIAIIVADLFIIFSHLYGY